MIIDRAQLLGVVSPTGQANGFYVPVFVQREHSNHLLVQVVDNQNYIVAFEPFLTSITIKTLNLEVFKNVGEAAFWYFELETGALFGSISDVRSQIAASDQRRPSNPYALLQIVTACGLERQEEQAARQVLRALLDDLGRASANAWLDTNVLTPKVRTWIGRFISKSQRELDIDRSTSQVLVFTEDQSTTALVPEDLARVIGESQLMSVRQRLEEFLRGFDLKFAGFSFVEAAIFESEIRSDIPLLKRNAVSAFASKQGVVLHQLSRSYFEDSAGQLRAVCTFSSRYENKGKRKYWFGFHQIWNQWLDGSKDSFLLLGCADQRICFALPLSFIREQLPHLRSTGVGKDRYWHIDLVDISGERNLLDVPRLRTAIPLSNFILHF
jgi:hypothetical protein